MPIIIEDTAGASDWARPYREKYFICPDGLRLFFRDYPNEDAKTTVLCLHGLTRNSADFNFIADRLKDQYRVITMDQRGRGKSDYDSDPMRYRPDIYSSDALQLIKELDLTNIILLGTSLGGLMSMIMAATTPEKFCGVILNDVGPVVEVAGLERIKSYLKKGGVIETWKDAAEHCKWMHSSSFPNYTDEDWDAFARRTYKEDEQGKPVPAFDYAIAETVIKETVQTVPPNLWPLFETMKDIPLLVLRGSLSDLLSEETAQEMINRHPRSQLQIVPNVGHAPILDEVEAYQAIDAFTEEYGS